MDFKETAIKGVYLITPKVIEDERGEFFRYFCEKSFNEVGLHNIRFVQLNHSINHNKGTLRGLHYQKPPFAEDKLVRCVKGSVQDVIVDLRKESPTFLNHIKIHLSAKNKSLVFIPKGMAHGFITLEENTELIYHHTNYYAPEAEAGLRYDDPILSVKWEGDISVISKRDSNHPNLIKNFTGLTI